MSVLLLLPYIHPFKYIYKHRKWTEAIECIPRKQKPEKLRNLKKNGKNGLFPYSICQWKRAKSSAHHPVVGLWSMQVYHVVLGVAYKLLSFITVAICSKGMVCCFFSYVTMDELCFFCALLFRLLLFWWNDGLDCTIRSFFSRLLAETMHDRHIFSSHSFHNMFYFASVKASIFCVKKKMVAFMCVKICIRSIFSLNDHFSLVQPIWSSTSTLLIKYMMWCWKWNCVCCSVEIRTQKHQMIINDVFNFDNFFSLSTFHSHSLCVSSSMQTKHDRWPWSMLLTIFLWCVIESGVL